MGLNVIEKRERNGEIELTAGSRTAVINRGANSWELRVDGTLTDSRLVSQGTAEAQAVIAFFGWDAATAGQYEINQH